MEIWKYGNMDRTLFYIYIRRETVKVKIYREYPEKIRDPSHPEHADKIDSREKASTSLARN